MGRVKGQQVGQIRHRQEQRGAVGQVSGRIGVWPHRGAQAANGGQHHGGQQHHGGVKAQHRRDDGGDDERPPQQAARPDAPARERRARRLEQALVVA